MPEDPQHATPIFKIVTRAQWRDALAHGTFAGSADDLRDGFIHLSAAHQVQGTLARHFRGQNDLMLAAFEAAALEPGLKWEVSRGGDLFPHLYAPLDPQLALWTRALQLDDCGMPLVPEGLLPPVLLQESKS